MQTLLCSIIIIFALIFVLKRWLPITLKQHLAHLLGQPVVATPAGGCGSCSSCGNCSAGTKSTQTDKKVFMIRRQ